MNFSRLLYYFEYYALAILLALIAVVVVIGIIARGLPFSLPWTVELAQTLLNWSVWLGISLCIKEGMHTRFTLVFELFPSKTRKFLSILSQILFAILLVILGFWALRLNIYYLEKQLKTPALGLSYFWVRIPIVIGCGLSLIRLFQSVREEIFKKPAGN